MERILVVHEMGRPTYSVSRGDTELMTYPGGIKITLKKGRVAEIKGIKVEGSAGGGTSPTKVEPEAESPAEPALTKAEADEFAKMEKEQAEMDAKARAQLEKTIGDLEHLHDHPPTHTESHFEIKEFVVGLGLKWLLTLAALKLTCKYWGVEVFWSGLMTVAGVDVGVRGVIGLIGQLLLQMQSLFYADEAIASIVMVLVLRKVSINQSLGQAIQITMTTKVFSVVVGSLLFAVMLRSIF